MADLRSKLKAVPDEPGVYLLKDSAGEVIYVGKAISLRDRLRSYFQSAPSGDPKGEALREEIDDFEVNVCANETDALILEASLIKKFKPRFNVILRDDKSYPYIAITMNEEFPRAILVRGKRVRGVRYYGPYVNAKAARKTLRLLQKVFPLRQCGGSKPGRGRGGPCLYRDMKMCAGPCSGEVDPREYMDTVRSFCGFLEGKHKQVVDDLERRMGKAARDQEYEKAARIRNQIDSARKVLAQSRTLSSSGGDYDVIGSADDGLTACFAVSQVRSGTHLGNLCFFTDLGVSHSEQELVGEFVKRYYDQTSSIPASVVVPVMPYDAVAIERWLATRRGSGVGMRVPARGAKKRELSLATANARLALEGARIARARDKNLLDRSMEELAQMLGLERYPLRIECYDISTLGGAASVGSMVVFQDGMPETRSYRRFRMKFTAGVDDVGMMREILYRRFKRYLKESERADRQAVSARQTGFARKPDLVIVDGGKGQMGAALEALGMLGIQGVEVAAIAKRLEEIYRPDRPDPLLLPRGSEALFLVQRIRDEAHRVAVEYHRSTMLKKTSASWLDDISGIGPERKKALLRRFGSPSAIADASLEEIESVQGIPRAVARVVFEVAGMQKEGGGGG